MRDVAGPPGTGPVVRSTLGFDLLVLAQIPPVVLEVEDTDN